MTMVVVERKMGINLLCPCNQAWDIIIYILQKWQKQWPLFLQNLQVCTHTYIQRMQNWSYFRHFKSCLFFSTFLFTSFTKLHPFYIFHYTAKYTFYIITLYLSSSSQRDINFIIWTNNIIAEIIHSRSAQHKEICWTSFEKKKFCLHMTKTENTQDTYTMQQTLHKYPMYA